ncbi:hypothetical protein V1514DRAFT_327886 [Lipomyces japonicus]|uniref:uncharacterized protein n=1 Tax=Lipomyces japonicus TaxID=56871 RepID=UPI0034CE1974
MVISDQYSINLRPHSHHRSVSTLPSLSLGHVASTVISPPSPLTALSMFSPESESDLQSAEAAAAYWINGPNNKSMLLTPPDEFLGSAVDHQSQQSASDRCVSSFGDCECDNVIEQASAVAVDCLSEIDIAEESVRLLLFDRSPAALLFADQIRQRRSLLEPGRPTFVNLIHAIPLSHIHQHLCANSVSATSSLSASSSSRSSLLASLTNDADYFSRTLFESFAVSRRGPVVPPGSLHFSLSLSFLPTHSLPEFKSFIRARMTELQTGGVLIFSYPTSLAFFYDTFLKVLDPLLHTLLALNKLSTTVCQRLSSPPDDVPNYEEQQAIIQDCGGELLFSTERNLKVKSWGAPWLEDEERWITDAMLDDGVAEMPGSGGVHPGRRGSQVVDGLAKGSELITGLAKTGIYVVRKL